MKDAIELINEIKTGNEIAFNELLEIHTPMIYKIINSYPLYNGDFGIDIDDLYQIGSIALYNCVFTFDESKGVKFGTYAYSCIRKQIINRYRDTFVKRKEEFYSIDAYDNNTFSYAYVKENALEYHREKEFKIVLDKFVSELNEEDKKIIDMRSNDFSYKDISERLQIKTKRIDNRLMNLRRRLKVYLRENGYKI